jgi:putative oxidoreductase
MHAAISLHNAIFDRVERLGDWILPLSARFLFAAVLLVYFWKSALTKFGDGFFGFLLPSDGAYIQIFPKYIESVGYDFDQLTLYHWAFAFAGMWAELLLPLLIVLGLFTRLAALGMIGFIAVQSFTDVYIAGHSHWGQWFDNIAEYDPAIKGIGLADIRIFWVFILAILVTKGAGALSADALLRRLYGQRPV